MSFNLLSSKSSIKCINVNNPSQWILPFNYNKWMRNLLFIAAKHVYAFIQLLKKDAEQALNKNDLSNALALYSQALIGSELVPNNPSVSKIFEEILSILEEWNHFQRLKSKFKHLKPWKLI